MPNNHDGVDPRFPLVPQAMIDAVQAANHHAADQRALQRVLQPAMEWLVSRRAAAARGEAVRLEPLTERETQIVVLLADGHRQESVAAQLNVCGGTVKRHIANIGTKLYTNSAVEIIAWYYKTFWPPHAQTIDVPKKVTKWRVVNEFLKDEFCPLFDTEEEARRNFNRHTSNDIRIERLDTTLTIVKNVSHQLPEVRLCR